MCNEFLHVLFLPIFEPGQDVCSNVLYSSNVLYISREMLAKAGCERVVAKGSTKLDLRETARCASRFLVMK